MDGHDFDQMEAALSTAPVIKGQLTAIVMKTIKVEEMQTLADYFEVNCRKDFLMRTE